MSELTPLPGRRSPEFQGRDVLDEAWGKFRKAGVDLLREAARSPEAMAAHAKITKEAAAVLTRLAVESRKATAESRRKRAVSAEDRLRRVLRKGVRGGSDAAQRMLQRLDEGGHDDAA